MPSVSIARFKASRGISIVIAELIIVSIAVAMSVMIIGYVNGWFEFGVSQSEGIYVYPDSRLVVDTVNNQVYADLHIFARYKPEIQIINIMLDKNRPVAYEVLSVEEGGPVTIDGDTVILPIGTKCWLRVYFDVDANSVAPDYGDRVEVVIITNIGFAYKAALKIVDMSG